MHTCRLKNKVVIIFVVLLILVGAYVCYSQINSEPIVGDFTKPIINVNGQLYGTTMDKNDNVEEDYTFYGYVESSVKEKIGVPDKNLQVTQIMKDNIGYKVYISQDKNFVAIFNEEMQAFHYYEKE